MAAVTLTAPVSPEAYRGGDDFSQWGPPRVYVCSEIDSTDTLDTGMPSIQRWAISKPTGGSITASLSATTGIFTFTVSAQSSCELLVWGPDTALVS